MVWETQSFQFYRLTSKFVVKFNYMTAKKRKVRGCCFLEVLPHPSGNSGNSGCWELWVIGD